jgi:hypothetical protein
LKFWTTSDYNSTIFSVSLDEIKRLVFLPYFVFIFLFKFFQPYFSKGVSLVDSTPDLAIDANLGFIPLLTPSLIANIYRPKHIRPFVVQPLAGWNLSTSGTNSWRMKSS